MCQRKIIGKGVFNIVPLLRGCDCPTIVEIRDIDTNPPVTHDCRDIVTGFQMSGYPVTFRICKCTRNQKGDCINLPPTYIVAPKYLAPQPDLSQEIWTENGRSLFYEPGHVDPEDYDDGPQTNIALL